MPGPYFLGAPPFGPYPRRMVERLSDAFGLTTAQAQLLVTAAVIVVLLLVRALIVAFVHRRIEDSAVWYRTRKALTYVTGLIAVVVVATIWFEGTGVLTYVGFLTAALAIALSDVVKNFAGWLYIVLRRPFRLGDRIEIAGRRGDVIDIRVFRFTMLEVGGRVRQVTGSMLHMPNGLVFTEPLTNDTEGFSYIWHEIPVLVTFESDWEAAEQLVLEAVREASAAISPEQVAKELRQTAVEYRFHIADLAPSVIVTVEDSGVLLTGRLLVAARGGRRATEQRVWRSVLKSFAELPDIDLAYPTVRTYLDGPVEVRSE
jgi:small-conductance mechanosensitive channel